MYNYVIERMIIIKVENAFVRDHFFKILNIQDQLIFEVLERKLY